MHLYEAFAWNYRVNYACLKSLLWKNLYSPVTVYLSISQLKQSTSNLLHFIIWWTFSIYYYELTMCLFNRKSFLEILVLTTHTWVRILVSLLNFQLLYFIIWWTFSISLILVWRNYDSGAHNYPIITQDRKERTPVFKNT